MPSWPRPFGDYSNPASGIGWPGPFDQWWILKKQRRQVSPEFAESIGRALVSAGIEFIDENGGGPGVRCASAKGRSRARDTGTARQHPG